MEGRVGVQRVGDGSKWVWRSAWDTVVPDSVWMPLALSSHVRRLNGCPAWMVGAAMLLHGAAFGQQIDRAEHRGTRPIMIGPRVSEERAADPQDRDRQAAPVDAAGHAGSRAGDRAAPKAESSSALEAARQLLDAGLEVALASGEAERLLRLACHEPADRAEAAARLWAMFEARVARGGQALPRDERRERELLEVLGPGFARFESRHVVVLSDATTERVHATLGTLERTRSMFLRFATRMGLSPVPEPSKSVCVVFATREGYIGFARAEDGLDASHLGGHYTPARERMSIYVDAPNQPPSEALTLRAMHEAAHMVSFRTLTQSVRRAQPFWLSEGLAGSFEASSVIGAFGPDVARPEARERMERLVARGEAMPLRVLLGQRAAPMDDPIAASAMYIQSEALVRYLVRHRRAQFGAYMRTLATVAPAASDSAPGEARRWRGHRTPEELVKEFVSHFGDPAAIERDLLRRPW